MYEYLAAGLPVVSTDLAEVRPFADVVRIIPPGDKAAFAEGQYRTPRSFGPLGVAYRGPAANRGAGKLGAARSERCERG